MADGKLQIQGDYVAEAKDEPSIKQTYLGERKKEFSFSFITPEEVQDIANELLEQNKYGKVYFDCKLRGNPYVKLLDKCRITAPKCSLSNLQCQIIKIEHTVKAGKWRLILGLVADLIQVADINWIMHFDNLPADHWDAGYYFDQTK